jgi:hypothetical protein
VGCSEKAGYERAMDIELAHNDLDKSIEVLSSASQALQLTRFERFSYCALMISGDVAIASFIALLLFNILFRPLKWMDVLVDSLLTPTFLVFLVSILVGIISLAFNIPLFLRIFRERARLKRLGLSSLSKSLWKETRRSQWINRVRGSLLVAINLLMIVDLLGDWLFGGVESPVVVLLTTTYATFTAGLLFPAQYLRNQRERMALTANAEELKHVLQSLLERAGDVEVVKVPSELLEQTAKIESAQIAKERKTPS